MLSDCTHSVRSHPRGPAPLIRSRYAAPSVYAVRHKATVCCAATHCEAGQPHAMAASIGYTASVTEGGTGTLSQVRMSLKLSTDHLIFIGSRTKAEYAQHSLTHPNVP